MPRKDRGPGVRTCYGTPFPHSSGTERSLRQFHGILENAIKLAIDEERYEVSKGMRAALWLFEGYFGVFKSKED